jgi:hypothetical protein
MLKIDIPTYTSSLTWMTLEPFIREQVQTCLQRVLDEDVVALLGRGRHERRGIGISIGAGRLSVEHTARSSTSPAPGDGRRRALQLARAP